MYACLSVLLHIDLFSFSWLQVCLNKFSSLFAYSQRKHSTESAQSCASDSLAGPKKYATEFVIKSPNIDRFSFFSLTHSYVNLLIK